MRTILPVFLILLIQPYILPAQNITGQWKGTFTDKSTSYSGWGGDQCDYVLELEINGSTVSGHSYTYFSEAGKKFYTICKLTGTVNLREKYIEVRETNRIKTNVPNHIRNCFQVHKLSYTKQSDVELLEGKWIPAPGQDKDCGYGITTLNRRLLKKVYPSYNKPITKQAEKNKTSKPIPTQVDKTKLNPPIAKQPVKKTEKNIEQSKPEAIEKCTNEIAKKSELKKSEDSYEFDKRNHSVIKTIEVDQPDIRIDLYDNGEVDGDSISLFYNNQLLISHKRLSEKPLSLFIEVTEGSEDNELVMHADNLGSIPPNTALMIIHDGNKRYEVRITSDLKRSGTIRFDRKPTRTN